MDTNLLSSNSLAHIKDNKVLGAVGSGIIGAIQLASARTGVDFAYLLNKADQESGLNPAAKAGTSSATGLFQFIKDTWLHLIKEHGAKYDLGAEADAISVTEGKATVSDPVMRKKILALRKEPEISAAMAAEFTLENKNHLEEHVGGKVGKTELYLAHFLGAGGAEKFIKAMRHNPQASAADILPQAAETNAGVFYDKNGSALSLKEIYNRFAAKFSGPPPVLASTRAPVSSAPAFQVASASGFHSVAGTGENPQITDGSVTDIPLPALPGFDAWRRHNATADTLFSTLVMAQTQMKDALKSDTDSKV